jgi:hypothetical protein
MSLTFHVPFSELAGIKRSADQFPSLSAPVISAAIWFISEEEGPVILTLTDLTPDTSSEAKILILN